MYNIHFFSRLTLDLGYSLFSLLGILVFLSTACLACFSQNYGDSPNCCICLVVQQVHRERCQSARCGRDVVQTHRSNQWLFCDFLYSKSFSPSIPHIRKGSVFLPCSSSERTIGFVMMLLPQLIGPLCSSNASSYSHPSPFVPRCVVATSPVPIASFVAHLPV